MAYVAPAVMPTGAGTRPLPVTQYIRDSLGVGASATAPTAGTAVATLTTPAAGRYSVRVNAGLGLGGVPAAAENLNMDLRVDGTVISKLPIVAAANTIVDCGLFVLTVDGAQSITVNAVGAATTATVYLAQILATRIGP